MLFVDADVTALDLAKMNLHRVPTALPYRLDTHIQACLITAAQLDLGSWTDGM
jgi:hypothetical protein